MNRTTRLISATFAIAAIVSSASWSLIAGDTQTKTKCRCGSTTVQTNAAQQSQIDDETTGTPKSLDWDYVCPHFWWMDYGSYKSYYAEYHYPQWCTPDNFDAAGEVDLLGDCNDPAAHCISASSMKPEKGSDDNSQKSQKGDISNKAVAGKKKHSDPGVNGYSGPMVAEYTGNWAEKLSPNYVAVEKVTDFIIEFKNGADDIFAQIFIGVVTQNDGTKTIVARGIQIKDPGHKPDYNYTGKPGQAPIKPAPGLGRKKALIYTYNGLNIQIILNHAS